MNILMGYPALALAAMMNRFRNKANRLRCNVCGIRLAQYNKLVCSKCEKLRKRSYSKIPWEAPGGARDGF